MELPYNPKDKKSVLEYAGKLKEKTLREVLTSKIPESKIIGKGSFGQILEEFYFGYKPNSKSEPDFPHINLELKSSPLKRLSNKKGGKKEKYGAKERLVLSIIDYLQIVTQTFSNSSFWTKNANMLFVFYLHEANVDILNFTIKLVRDWEFPDADLEIIKRDWEFIKQKIATGKAHELSEGDTFYLGACTKGASAKTLRDQPNNSIRAKQRAYSLKQGYVNHIVATIAGDMGEVYGKLITSATEAKKKTIEEIVTAKFKPYYGKSVSEIISSTQLQHLKLSAKNFHANLTKAVLGIELKKEIEEIEKAEIIVKTVRLAENNLPKEDISFPSFKYTELVKETWDESSFKEILERKFLFVFFQYEAGELVLRKVLFWNMPHKDILGAKKVWARTKKIVSEGAIVKNMVGDKRHTNFPNKEFSKIAHVRPHAQNKNDAYPLPFKDKYTGAKEYTKHCFWLNNTYVRDKIYLK